MQSKGILLIVSGPSGAGKGTVVSTLAEKGNFALSVSATTRSPRNYEQEGVHYFFKKREEFQAMIEADAFIEHACFVDNYYGTPKAYVEEQMAKGVNVILEIEVQGALQIKEKMPQAVLVFLLPPSIEELRNRLVGRGTEDWETINKRISRAVEELAFLPQYDYLVINEDVAQAAREIEKLVESEQLRAFRNLDIIQQFKGEI